MSMPPPRIGLLRKKRERTAPFPSTEKRASNWLDLWKLIFVVVPFVWALYLYFEHDRQEKILANESMRLSNEQASKLSKTEFDLKTTALEQQRLALRMSEIAAQAESERSQLALDQQRLAVESAKTSASVQMQREKLSLSIAELDRGIKRHELSGASNSKITGTASIHVSCDPEGQRLATYSVSISNNSDTKSVEISWELRSIFVGLPHERPRSTHNVTIFRLNEPPDPYTGTQSDSPISWQSLGDVGYVYPGSKAAQPLGLTAFYFKNGGLLTKLLRPRDKSSSTIHYEVNAPAGSWVAIVLRLGIDGETSGDGIFRYASWEKLSSCNVHKVVSTGSEK